MMCKYRSEEILVIPVIGGAVKKIIKWCELKKQDPNALVAICKKQEELWLSSIIDNKCHFTSKNERNCPGFVI